MFEYGAILKGSQTSLSQLQGRAVFEYGAILKGSQTSFAEYDVSGKV